LPSQNKGKVKCYR